MNDTDVVWQAWRRPIGDQCRWEKVPGIDTGKESDVFAAVLRQHWKAYAVDYEYQIMPVGREPSERFGSGKRGNLSQTYQTKRMLPG